MSVDPKNWLAMEQLIEDKNCVLLQFESVDTEQQ
jgi:hypothetical protein